MDRLPKRKQTGAAGRRQDKTSLYCCRHTVDLRILCRVGIFPYCFAGAGRIRSRSLAGK